MKTTLYIQNLKGLDSEKAILKRLSGLKHIKSISFKQQFGTMTFDYTSKEDIDRVKHVLSEIGFPPYGEKNLLRRKKISHLKKLNHVR
ncbi:heavy metal transporter [Gaetbulibacter sp. M240]|uniref:heavy metal transporter n=1 Tax=Gaetbulibacter sp. M240 TaxID=3126511 RepID=UPI00374E7861